MSDSPAYRPSPRVSPYSRDEAPPSASAPPMPPPRKASPPGPPPPKPPPRKPSPPDPPQGPPFVGAASPRASSVESTPSGAIESARRWLVDREGQSPGRYNGEEHHNSELPLAAPEEIGGGVSKADVSASSLAVTRPQAGWSSTEAPLSVARDISAPAVPPKVPGIATASVQAATPAEAYTPHVAMDHSWGRCALQGTLRARAEERAQLSHRLLAIAPSEWNAASSVRSTLHRVVRCIHDMHMHMRVHMCMHICMCMCMHMHM